MWKSYGRFVLEKLLCLPVCFGFSLLIEGSESAEEVLNREQL